MHMFTACPYELQCTNCTKCCGVALTNCFYSTFNFGEKDLRWYWKPFNIFSNERILKSDKSYGLKIFKIYEICLKIASIKLV